MTTSPARMSGLLAAAIATSALGAALYFQHVLGYQPCQLCLWQRWAYFLGIPVALAAALSGRRDLLILFALMFAANALLGLYHAGIEWKFWEGPSTCSAGAVAASSGNLLQDLKNVRIVPCDSAPWRFLGLSFAGWNMAISAALAGLAAFGSRRPCPPLPFTGEDDSRPGGRERGEWRVRKRRQQASCWPSPRSADALSTLSRFAGEGCYPQIDLISARSAGARSSRSSPYATFAARNPIFDPQSKIRPSNS